jgi:hypothetical protein
VFASSTGYMLMTSSSFSLLHWGIVGVVTSLSSHSQSSKNGDVARSPCNKAEGPFSED